MPFEDEPFAWSCPAPLENDPRVTMAHGGGGRLTAELVEQIFLPAFDNPALRRLADAALIDVPGGNLAIATDSFVVRPLFFPGGSLGELAVHGTVNDLAMRGAAPKYLAASFILEEGLPMETLARLVQRMACAANEAGVVIAAGDTKVVERGHGDGCYVTTTGIGFVPPNLEVGPEQIHPGDAILLSGSIGNHGMAIMSVREGLEFETPIRSDTASLVGLVSCVVQHAPSKFALRDPTRGGLAGSLNELAAFARVGMLIDEAAVPVDDSVQAACEILGLDPLQVANEGKLVAIVPATHAAAVLEAMRRHPLGARTQRIGTVVEGPSGQVVMRTRLGGKRIVPQPLGEQLPRIC